MIRIVDIVAKFFDMVRNLIYVFLPLVLLFTGCEEGTEDPDNNNETENTALSQDVINEFLEAHNRYRSEVGVGHISWSEEVAESAQAWADELSRTCSFEHSNNEQYGENLWAGTAGAFTVADVVDAWGGEKAYYDYESNTCESGEVCGHYTQVVWANSTEVGCGMVTCEGLEYWVCQYAPPGNVVGERPY